MCIIKFIILKTLSTLLTRNAQRGTRNMERGTQNTERGTL